MKPSFLFYRPFTYLFHAFWLIKSIILFDRLGFSKMYLIFMRFLLHFIYADAAKKFKAIQAWWRDMAERNCKSVVRPAASTSYCFVAQKTSTDAPRGYFMLLP